MIDTQDETSAAPLLDKVFAAARPRLVFGDPVVTGAYTVITASEVMAGGGFGFGRGQTPARGEAPMAGGHGVGGGGGSAARPVAAIVIGPDGVRVEPIVDATKLGLAGITALGAMVVVLARIARRGRAKS